MMNNNMMDELKFDWGITYVPDRHNQMESKIDRQLANFIEEPVAKPVTRPVKIQNKVSSIAKKILGTACECVLGCAVVATFGLMFYLGAPNSSVFDTPNGLITVYEPRATYIGDNLFVTNDGNIWEYSQPVPDEDEDEGRFAPIELQLGARYTLSMDDNGTPDNIYDDNINGIIRGQLGALSTFRDKCRDFFNY